MLPLALTVVAETLPTKLVAVTAPVAEIRPPVSRLPTVTLPVAVIMPLVDTLPPTTLPVKLTLVPVAAPMFGVTKLAPALMATLLNISISKVLGSTLTLNVVPTRLRPLPALYETDWLNKANVIASNPMMISPTGELSTKLEPMFTLPDCTK